MKTILTELAEYIASVNYNDLPPEVQAKSRRVLFDTLGVMLTGFHKSRLAPVAQEYVIEQGGKKDSTIVVSGVRVPAGRAAFCNAISAHSIEMDDGHRYGTSHPAVAVIPAAIAVAERENLAVRDLLNAIVCGYEVMLRVAVAINPSHLSRGFHSTGTCGSLGAAAACGRLLGFNHETMTHAISLGALQSAGIQEMLHDHPEIKPLQAGHAAEAGVLSADLARKGAKGPRTLFEGEHGWFKAMADKTDANVLFNGIGEHWEIMRTYTKLYPTCRHCHAAVDLAVLVHNELETNKISLTEIESITVETYGVSIREVGQIQVPQNQDEAMFSLPYAVAIALSQGSLSLFHFYQPKDIQEPWIELAKRVSVLLDENMDKRYPAQRGARLTIKLTGNQTIVKETPLPKGEPEIPISDQELKEKIRLLTEEYTDNQWDDKLWEVCVDENVCTSVRKLIEIIGERLC